MRWMSYRVWVDPQALAEAKAVPGNVRQRLKRCLEELREDPRPIDSKRMQWTEAPYEPRRIRIGDWRVIYAVDDTDRWVWVLAVRKRPPYDYGDLAELLASIQP
jgi:mRNA-degrading endonuclease RelE of RelBE toxin-antitoxin system